MARCTAKWLNKSARETSSGADAENIAYEKCMPDIENRFALAGPSCLGNAVDVGDSLSRCISDFARTDRGLFGAVPGARIAVAAMGATLRCWLKVYAKYPAAESVFDLPPDETYVCERSFLTRVGDGSDGVNLAGDVAYSRLALCLTGVDNVIADPSSRCDENKDCVDNDPCTFRRCQTNLQCSSMTILCDNKNVCDTVDGCPACTTNADCEDEDKSECTYKECEAGACVAKEIETCGPGFLPKCDDDLGCVECKKDSQCAPSTGCSPRKCIDYKCETEPVVCDYHKTCSSGSCIQNATGLIPGDCTQDGRLELDQYGAFSDAICIYDCYTLYPNNPGCVSADCDCNGVVNHADITCGADRASGIPIANDHCVITRGDVRHDGYDDFDDDYLQSCVNGQRLPNLDCYAAADCDCDGALAQADVQCARDRRAGVPITNGPGGTDRCELCPAGSQLELVPAPYLFAQSGSIMSPSATGVPVSLGDNAGYTTAAKRIGVKVIDPAYPSAPYTDCKVSWATTSIADGKAHAIPASALSASRKKDGVMEAWWIAGTNVAESMTATIQRTDGIPTSKVIQGSLPVSGSNRETSKQYNRYVGFGEEDAKVNAAGFQLDVKPINMADHTFLAAPLSHAHRMGIQLHGGSPFVTQTLQMTAWRYKAGNCQHFYEDGKPYVCNDENDPCSCDPKGLSTCAVNDHQCRGPIPVADYPDEYLGFCTQNGQIVQAPCHDDPTTNCPVRCTEEKEKDDCAVGACELNMHCHAADDGNKDPVATTCVIKDKNQDGTGPLWPVDRKGQLWRAGDTLRMRWTVTTDTVEDFTMFKFYMANLGNPPVESTPLLLLSSIKRVPAEDFSETNMSAFIEQLGGTPNNCYANPDRTFELSNPRYLPAGDPPELDSNWLKFTTASMGGKPGCQNDLFTTTAGGTSFLMSTGGTQNIGPPFLHPSRVAQTIIP
jgi:hypothetical protein